MPPLIERDTLKGYREFLAAYPHSDQARRVRAILALRREAAYWRRTVGANTPRAYWTYLHTYPKGPHIPDARRRLAMLSAEFEPPPDFRPEAFADLPPPPPDELVYDDRPIYAFDDFGPPPPPPPDQYIYVEDDGWRDLPPPPPPAEIGLLPVLGVAIPIAVGAIAYQHGFHHDGVAPRGQPQFRQGAFAPPPLPANIRPVAPPAPVAAAAGAAPPANAAVVKPLRPMGGRRGQPGGPGAPQGRPAGGAPPAAAPGAPTAAAPAVPGQPPKPLPVPPAAANPPAAPAVPGGKPPLTPGAPPAAAVAPVAPIGARRQAFASRAGRKPLPVPGAPPATAVAPAAPPRQAASLCQPGRAASRCLFLARRPQRPLRQWLQPRRRQASASRPGGKPLPVPVAPPAAAVAPVVSNAPGGKPLPAAPGGKPLPTSWRAARCRRRAGRSWRQTGSSRSGSANTSQSGRAAGPGLKASSAHAGGRPRAEADCAAPPPAAAVHTRPHRRWLTPLRQRFTLLRQQLRPRLVRRQRLCASPRRQQRPLPRLMSPHRWSGPLRLHRP